MKIIVVTRHREKKILDPLSKSNIDYRCVTSDRKNLIRENLDIFSEIKRHLQNEEFDLILADHADFSGFLAAILSCRYQVPLVVRLGGEVWTINNNKIKEAKKDKDISKYTFLKTLSLVNKYTLDRSDGFLTVSNHLRENVISKFNIERKRVQTVNVPITNRFIQDSISNPVREEYNIDQENIIITVTNLRFGDKYRGVSQVIPGIFEYLTDNQDAAWVIAGGGYYQSKVEHDVDRIIDDESVRERIFVLGHVDSIENIYSLGDIFVYNSYLDGYPNVILEAQMTGVPVITTNQEGMSEQIEDLETGLFFSSTEPSDLKKKISMVFDNPELRKKISTNARQKVLEQNSASFIAKQLEEALSIIIS